MTVQSKSLNELDCAIDYLRQHGAARDAAAGQWMIDGIALGANPLIAARNLRASMIAKSIEAARNSGRYFTR